MHDCIFCKILSGEIPSSPVYEDDQVIAFRDIHPQAPVHILVVPRAHIPYPSSIRREHESLAGHMVAVAGEIAQKEGFEETGYRLVMNHRESAGQSVFHIHLHILAGRPFAWPPG
ncbi:MAG TPA: histidine triad nucleotide-binding protein [Thermoanaerobaculia bacterium]|mgnify:CR=1 FL=1|nr:histidine triad nucleotide-binding protein [Thermoanaerobaculia bacterium]HUM30838.1 histidine triad nucleotide-binding protein [Thermoanaerobaculia bacterium]HXK69181.1 histidine triad nucleotide-binding protein [Thermoanaerobaculia bacterium]